jgi:hypothetical protein
LSFKQETKGGSMKAFLLTTVLLSSSVFANSVPKRVAFIDMGRSIGTGYFIKAQNESCGEGKAHTYFISAAHVVGKVPEFKTFVPSKKTLDFVTGSSAGNPLEILKFLAPVAIGIATGPAGAAATDVLTYVQSGSEVLGQLHYDLTGNNIDMELVSSNDKKTVGLLKRLSSQKPTLGTYFRVGMNHVGVSSCQDTMKLDIDKLPERTDVEYFKLSSDMPHTGEELSTLGFPVSTGRAVLKGCIYEGLSFVEASEHLNSPSFLHSMRCPQVLMPQGLSGGPVLNSKGEVVGTVTRGAVYYKSNYATRSAATIVTTQQQINVIGTGYLETVLYFSELNQENVSCDGKLNLGYRGSKILDTLNTGAFTANFDQQGCLSHP